MGVLELLMVVAIFSSISIADGLEVDPKGYILYCPCMGRFGNQADQFLGSLAFARAIDRTLVLPPWVEYGSVKPSSQIPFDTYFNVEPLQKYHRVMLMEDFMKELAPTVWPVGQRTSFCYSERHSESGATGECHAKEGNPFGPFWDNFNVDFDKSEFFGPLYYETENSHEIQRWKKKYPPEKFPVMAFVGAPAVFPIKKHHVRLQKYMEWSDDIRTKAENFIKENIERPFVGIHLRLGVDFQRACEHIEETPTMFAAAQCIGYRQEFGTTTKEMCYQSFSTIKKELKRAVKKNSAKTVFVATDSTDLIDKLSKAMEKIKFVRQPGPSSPHLDLAILQASDHFIGNCISTFTAIVKRARDVEDKSSSFWAFKSDDKKKTKTKKDEL